MKLLTVMMAALTGGAAAAADTPAAVTLSDQRVHLAPGDGGLSVEVTVHNTLDVALSSVEVGWLLAPQASDLAAIRDPGALYLDADDPKHVVAPAAVTVLRRSVEVTVPAHGAAVASFVAHGGDQTGAVTVYRTHVLGYALADASLSLELRLLHGSAAADEKAAVDYFGLASDAPTRLLARRRLMGVSAWVDALVASTSAPVPARPTVADAHERIFVTRALGVVGGPRAEATLAQLRDRSDIETLDEQLRVVSIDRLRSTRLETPLAFAVPKTARTMRDVVEAALADARDLTGQVEKARAEETRASTAASPAVEPGPAQPEPAPGAVPEKSLARTIVPWIAAVFGFIFTMFLIRGRRR